MAGPVEEKPFENAVRCEQASHTSWHIIEVRTGVQVASVTADADRVWDIVRLINDDVAARREHHQLISGEGDDRLTLDFEGGELAKVSGVRPELMDGHALIRMVKRLAKLNLAQETEIARYKAEAAEEGAQPDYAFPQAFSYKDRSIATGGLTKREWLTGTILATVGAWLPTLDREPDLQAGILSAADLIPTEQARLRARWAMMQADAALAELSRPVRS